MEELNKIYRVIDRELPYSDREIFLVLDATTGQNAISQAKEFMSVTEVSGIVLTKLDGTARGGVVLSINNDLKLPVKFIGVGEGLDDLQPFSAETFAESLFDVEPPEEASNYEPIITVNEERLARDKAEAAAREVERQKAEAEEKERLAAEAAAKAAEEAEAKANEEIIAEPITEEATEEILEEIEEIAEVLEEVTEEKQEEVEPEEVPEETVEEEPEVIEEAPKKEEKKEKKSFWKGLFGDSGEYIG